MQSHSQNVGTADTITQAHTVSFTKFRNTGKTGNNPKAFATKEFSLVDGVLTKSAQISVHQGEAEPVEVRGLHGLCATLHTLDHHTCLLWGVPTQEGARLDVSTKKKRNGKQISRTREYFKYSDQAGVLMIDVDAPAGEDFASVDEVTSRLFAAVPELKNFGYVVSPSCSAFIYNGDDMLRGLGGLRIYMIVDRATDIPAIGKLLVSRLWLKGEGYIKVSESGSMLERSLIDASVWQPERCDFAARGVYNDGLVSKAPPAKVVTIDRTGTPLTLNDLRPLNDSEKAQELALIAAAKADKAPEAAAARAEYVDKRAPRLAAKRGCSVEEAKKTLGEALDGGVLPPEWELTAMDGTTVTVADLLANPKKWHRARFLDPIEPGHRGGEDYCAVAYLDNPAAPLINSLAHGDTKYRLKEPAATKAERTAEAKALAEMTGLPTGFRLTDEYLYYKPFDTDKPASDMRVCGPLHVTASVRDEVSSNHGREVQFVDEFDVHHSWVIPMSMLAGDGKDVRTELMNHGLWISHSPAARLKFMDYLTESKPAVSARCVGQTGWYRDVFVMPDKVVGTCGEEVRYQSTTRTECAYAQLGTTQDWRNSVGRLCKGNSRLIVAASAAFAGMLLHDAGQASGGINFVGASSIGKSSAQLVAASVYGSAKFKQSWKATGNALEATCAIHNDAALILDEMGQVEPRELGAIAYMIGNGEGKGRADRSGAARDRKRWRTMLISSGERTIAQHMGDSGQTVRAGQEVRIVDIPADAGVGHGTFEDLHGMAGGADIAKALAQATASAYGSPSITFLEYLTSTDREELKAGLQVSLGKFAEEYLPPDASGQADRVCARMALIAAAGELATVAGITGWATGEATAAAAACFNAWLSGRGGAGNQEEAAVLSQVRAFFEAHGESRFVNKARGMHERDIPNRVGFREYHDFGDKGWWSYYVLPEMFKKELCKGFDPVVAAKALISAGRLEPGKDNPKTGKKGSSTQNQRLPWGGSARVYCFVRDVLADVT